MYAYMLQVKVSILSLSIEINSPIYISPVLLRCLCNDLQLISYNLIAELV